LGISRARGLPAYISAQNEYSLLERQIDRELLPACRHFGVGILPFFPLASGFLTGKYRRGAELPKGTRMALMERIATRTLTEPNFDLLEKLENFARERGHTLLELAVGWLVSEPQNSSVICGATTPEQVSQNVKAGEWRLSAEEREAVDKLTRR
jgi:aryl-alcohol dehydrogenase-like predicted oxidoreductase